MNRKLLLLLWSCIFYGSFCHGTDLRKLRMAGGVVVDPGSIRYIVAIYYGQTYVCSGTILDSRHILTAALCIFNPKNDEISYRQPHIVAGITSLSDSESGIKAYVEKIYIPSVNEDRSNANILNRDIAILKLQTELDVEQDERLEAAYLPDRGEMYSYIVAEMASFGNYKLDQEDSSLNVLRTASVFLPDTSLCREFVKHIRDNQICGKITNNLFKKYAAGICEGDGGAPLSYAGKIIAVTSYPTKLCRDKAEPTVFTKTTPYLDFIENAINDNVVHMDVRTFEPIEC